MHHAAKWPGIVERMVPRMEGKGNMGKLMVDMMAGVKAPDRRRRSRSVAYLRKHAQKPLDPKKYPEAFTAAGEPFRLACNQCHTLPDPQRYTAQEWPAVVARMQENMEWMNRVVGTQADSRRAAAAGSRTINAFLAKYAQKMRNRGQSPFRSRAKSALTLISGRVGTAMPRSTAGRAAMVSNQRFTAGKSSKSTLCHS